MSKSTELRPRNKAKKLSAEEQRKMREDDHRIVRGIFRSPESSGARIDFSFKKYKGDSVENYSLLDGETYDIPIMVAKHINKNCNYPKHRFILDENGNPVKDIGQMVQRFSFESLEFQEMEEKLAE